jgi:actin-like protein 6B
MAEILFEEFKVPAFYIANSGVLTAFVHFHQRAIDPGTDKMIKDLPRGRAPPWLLMPGVTGPAWCQSSTALSYGRVSSLPLYSTLLIHIKGIQRSALSALKQLSAGQMLQKRRDPINLISHQLIASKMPVQIDSPPQFTLREDRRSTTTDSWVAWSHSREIEEWLTAVGGVYDVSYANQ